MDEQVCAAVRGAIDIAVIGAVGEAAGSSAGSLVNTEVFYAVSVPVGGAVAAALRWQIVSGCDE